MDIYTVDRSFERQDVLETFISTIWTERFFGDSDSELLLEPTSANVNQFAPGTFLIEENSPEPQIVDTLDIEDGKLKVSGISLTQWLNNRFIRSSPWPDDKSWDVEAVKPGVLMGQIVQNWCIDSVYLNNRAVPLPAVWPDSWTIDDNTMGVPYMYLSRLKLTDLYLGDVDDSDDPIDYSVPFGPVYDALKDIAQAYILGQRITLDEFVPGEYHVLRYHVYKGLDRTSTQHVRPMVRFSPDMESLTNVKELHSISSVIGLLVTFPVNLNAYEVMNSSGHPPGMTPSGATSSENDKTVYYSRSRGDGWDLRAAMNYDEDLIPEDVGGKPPSEGPSSSWDIVDMQTAANAIGNKIYPKQQVLLSLPQYRGATFVDGEVVPTNQFKYGQDYNLGDIVEIEGHSGSLNTARVTEYIRAQDDAGYREYPTVELTPT